MNGSDDEQQGNCHGLTSWVRFRAGPFQKITTPTPKSRENNAIIFCSMNSFDAIPMTQSNGCSVPTANVAVASEIVETPGKGFIGNAEDCDASDEI